MPSRREPRRPAGSPPAETIATAKARSRWHLPLPNQRTLVHLAIAAGGALLGTSLLGLIWPVQDRALAPQPEIGPDTLAARPSRPVTVLVIGSDADRLGAPLNGAAPAGPANADALVLLRVHPQGPLQVLNLPTELAVNLPGQKGPLRLGELYRIGGVALTADGVRELVGLEPPKPDRYLVIPRGALRDLVNGLGGLEISPPRTMSYTDKKQKFTVNLEAGLQQLGGAGVEQLVRFQDRWLGEAGRRTNQQLVQSGLRERMLQPDRLSKLPFLVTQLQGKVETNLSASETLSLLAAGLDERKPVQFTTLPLKPAEERHKGLRQLDPSASQPLWKEPAP